MKCRLAFLSIAIEYAKNQVDMASGTYLRPILDLFWTDSGSKTMRGLLVHQLQGALQERSHSRPRAGAHV